MLVESSPRKKRKRKKKVHPGSHPDTWLTTCVPLLQVVPLSPSHPRSPLVLFQLPGPISRGPGKALLAKGPGSLEKYPEGS